MNRVPHFTIMNPEDPLIAGKVTVVVLRKRVLS
jgi:hypothetical protein